MKTQVASNAVTKTDEEYQQEIDRMADEIRAMLKESDSRLEHASRVRLENRRLLTELGKRYL